MTEQWLPVVGFEGLFEVSNLGRIRSVPRVLVRRNGMLYTVRGRVLRTFPAGAGGRLRKVTLSSGGRAGQRSSRLVHRLAAEAWGEQEKAA
jgi:NUMOD4 motif